MKIPKIVKRPAKRLGRGFGSGKGGHTSSRGQKGQMSRGRINLLFEGLKTKKSLIKRLPLIRGKGKNKGYPKPVLVKLGDLNGLKDGSKVNVEFLVKQGFISASKTKKFGVKIVSGGELTKKLEVQVAISKPAADVVTKLGGKIG